VVYIWCQSSCTDHRKCYLSQRDKHVRRKELWSKKNSHLPQFDLVMTDFRLPGMRGDQLAQEIKRRNPLQRIILIAGFPPVIRPAACERMLAKPFAVAELRSVIAELA
jgi:CheY-like chemotaxis protein